MNDPAIYRGKWLSFHPITVQAQQFLRGLAPADWRHFTVAATILEISLRSGRPPAGRAERVRGSRAGMFELRVTPPGRKGAHVRLLYVCDGRRVLIARGLVKRQAALPRRDVELAEQAVEAWRKTSDEKGEK